MPQNKLLIKINLNKKSGQKFESIFLKWSIQAGRLIIILTELIALGALSYRFIIDRQIIDLHDQIKKQELFVRSQEKKEIEYRSIQERLLNIQQINQETRTKITTLNEVIGLINTGNFVSTNLVVNQNIITISGSAFSIFAINDVVNTLKKNPEVNSISIEDINSTEQGLEFKLTIELKKSGKI